MSDIVSALTASHHSKSHLLRNCKADCSAHRTQLNPLVPPGSYRTDQSTKIHINQNVFSCNPKPRTSRTHRARWCSRVNHAEPEQLPRSTALELNLSAITLVAWLNLAYMIIIKLSIRPIIPLTQTHKHCGFALAEWLCLRLRRTLMLIEISYADQSLLIILMVSFCGDTRVFR